MSCGRPGRVLARLTKINISDCLELLGCSEVRPSGFYTSQISNFSVLEYTAAGI